MQRQAFVYFVAVDFQTVSVSPQSPRKGITEINAVAVNVTNFNSKKMFAGCCDSMLADFSFRNVLNDFSHWLRQLNGPFVLVTDKYSALAVDFQSQCVRLGINVPPFAMEWLNITEFWRRRYGNRTFVSCDLLLELYGKKRILEHGKQSSLCNARSLAVVVIEVLRTHRNFPFRANERMHRMQIPL